MSQINSHHTQNSCLSEKQKKQDAVIAGLDPLNFDDDKALIPNLNKKGKVNELVDLLYQKLPHPENIKAYTYAEAAACMRDIGIFLGSIKKHGYEPVTLVSELEYILDRLRDKTDLPPRDTLLHYTVWNPDGPRKRTYTGTKDEIALIDSVKLAMHPLLEAIEYLEKMHHLSPLDFNYSNYAASVGKKFEKMIEGVVKAKKEVDPSYFANELRLYFDSIYIFQKDYIGPGAVEMPVFVYDHLLWSSQVEDATYREFKITFLPYVLPDIRALYYHYDGHPSLITKMVNQLKKNEFHPHLRQNAKALMGLCKLLKSFRIPHKKVADKAYEAENGNQREKGSGGYSPDVLGHIIQVNHGYINRLSTVLENYPY